MTRRMSTVRTDTLLGSTAGLDSDIPVGSVAWLEWLNAPLTTSFRFEHGADGFTARREKRTGGLYWYAYRKFAGDLRKAYLGRANELNLDRLESVVAALGHRRGEPLSEESRVSTRVVPNRAQRGDNLPAQPTSFVGRSDALAQLTVWLETARLLTLTGSGGVGKTRLALELAATVRKRFPDGVWLVDIAPLCDPELVVHEVATTLGLREEAGRGVFATVASALNDKQVLLLLDNCEHLVQACAGVVDGLLRACPQLRVLATSREALAIDGETLWRLSPLSLPDPTATGTALSQSEAVQLFVERARHANATFELTEENGAAVASVCSHLDGIPLALELAATRVRSLSVKDIAARMEDRFTLLGAGRRATASRHSTLKALVDWSYDLLSEHERILFARLSVFAGGWTLNAAELVCGDDVVTSTDVVSCLSQLVDKSLILLDPGPDGEGRYRFLETLRQYASEKLSAGADLYTYLQRHAEFFLGLAERIEPEFSGAHGRASMERLESDYDNFRSALRYLVTSGDVERAQQLAVALGPFWVAQGAMTEGRLRSVELLADGAGRIDLRAKLCIRLGQLIMVSGDFASALAPLQAGLVLARAAADRTLIAHALGVVSNVSWLTARCGLPKKTLLCADA